LGRRRARSPLLADREGGGKSRGATLVASAADLWTDGDVVSFEARVLDRGATVIRNGKTVLRT